MILAAPCDTKQGRRIWLLVSTGNSALLGRSEIAHLQFKRYLLKKEAKGAV